jgi:hypothetical protein
MTGSTLTGAIRALRDPPFGVLALVVLTVPAGKRGRRHRPGRSGRETC